MAIGLLLLLLAWRTRLLHSEVRGLRRSHERLRLVEDELKTQAFHDPLTKLANRELFADRVQHALELRTRDQAPVAILFLDLDDFKSVNDSLGHAAGDQLLLAAAHRISECVRPSDTLARFGGDEFAVLLEETSAPDGAVRTAERVLASLQAPFVLEGREVSVRSSVGIAFSAPGLDADRLLRNADVAMYRAKSQGKGRYALYAPEMHDAIVRRMHLRTELERAMEHDELFLAYQPIVDLDSGALVGIEALLRWNHPRRGHLHPTDFMSVAGESGLMSAVNRWVLERACSQVNQWQRRFPAHGELILGVNLSGSRLRVSALVRDVTDSLERTGYEARKLMLELPESLLLPDVEAALEGLVALKRLGVRLALDNFGRGYLSPSSLESLPIDVVKIDKHFVDSIASTSETSELATAIIKVAIALRLDVVAEGIESTEQWARLREVSPVLGQGYLIARPMRSSSVESLLAGDPASVLRGPAQAARAAT